jgi:hypothetical protein
MNIFSGISHFFTSLFGKNADTAQKVLHNVSSFVTLAEPVVAEVETEVKQLAAVDPNAKLQLVAKFLSKYEPDLAKVASTANSLSGLPEADLLHNLATIALSTLVPSGTAASLVNLAIELAYNIFKTKSAATAAPAAAPKAA